MQQESAKTELSDNELIQAGADLRKNHFSQCSPSRLTGCISSTEAQLGHVARLLGFSRLIPAFKQLLARQQRSIAKRKEKLRSFWTGQAPRPIPRPFKPARTPQPLFSERYYITQSPAKRRPKTTFWDDYRETGWKLGLNPHPLFDTQWYLKTNPDVKATGEEPLTHFLNIGWKEGRNPNPYFQTDWYIAKNPEILEQEINPLLHYLKTGWRNGRDPSPKFSLQRYFDDYEHADKTVEPLGEWVQELALNLGADRRLEYRRWPTTYLPSDVEPQPAPTFGKVAVQLHAFYLDKLDLLLDHLRYIPVRFDLLVSTDTPEHAREIETIVARSGLDCALDVRCSQNRGRDVAPLICLFGRKLLEYDCALHIHTKKSAAIRPDSDYGHQWLLHNLAFLVRNREYVQSALSIFAANPNCGVLTPQPWKGIRRVMTWTSNRAAAEELIKRLRLPTTALKTQPLMFPGGTMFWFRPAALKSLLASDLQFEDFPPEPLANDGTLAHAIERCILYIAVAQGYHSLVIAPSIYKPIS